MKFQENKPLSIKDENQEKNEGLAYKVTNVLDKMPQEMKDFCEVMKLPEGEEREKRKEEINKKFPIEKWHLFINEITNGAYLDHRNLNHVIGAKKRSKITGKPEGDEFFNPTERLSVIRLTYDHFFFSAGENPFLGAKNAGLMNPGRMEEVSPILIFSIENKNFYNWMVAILRDEIKTGKIGKNVPNDEPRFLDNKLKEKNEKSLLKKPIPSKSFSSIPTYYSKLLPLFLLNRACIDSNEDIGTIVRGQYIYQDFFKENGFSNLFNRDSYCSRDESFKWIDMARYIFDPASGNLYEPADEFLTEVPEKTFIGNFEDLEWDFQKKE